MRSSDIDFPSVYLITFLFMAKIWFGRPGTQPDQGDLKGEKEISWCKNNLGPLTFHFSTRPVAKDAGRRIPDSTIDAKL